MGSITSWNRLEPQSNDPSLGSLAARVADPLWLLARQWQFREWQGEDAGSPVEVRVRYAVGPVTRYRPGTVSPGAVGMRPPERPWEALVEAESRSSSSADRREAVAAGERFLDALGPTLAPRYAAALRARHPVAELNAGEAATADERSQRLAGLLAGRSLDGYALHGAILAAGGQAPFRVEPGDEAAVASAISTWVSWMDGRLAPADTDAWQPDRLRYAFAVAAPTTTGEVVLAARDHRGGRVDWTAFEAEIGGSLGAAGDATVVERQFAALPTGLAFPGMPAPRWWQFEDGRVDLGGIEAAPDDLGRLLLAEFALVYGNDYFGVPLPLPAGSISRVTQLEVSTTFGETVVIPVATTVDTGAPTRWRMFQLGTGTPGDDRAAGWLVVPASAVDALSSEPIEDVLFSRDEMANVAWAVERRVTGPAGRAMERRESYHRGQPDPDRPPGTPPLRYRLASEVPPHWLPLVPTAAGAGRVRLELRGPAQPLGRLLSASAGFALAAEELPRAGVLATRHHRRSRWTDGTTAVWVARRVRSGRGESSAGLRFDDLVAEP